MAARACVSGTVSKASGLRHRLGNLFCAHVQEHGHVFRHDGVLRQSPSTHAVVCLDHRDVTPSCIADGWLCFLTTVGGDADAHQVNLGAIDVECEMKGVRGHDQK